MTKNNDKHVSIKYNKCLVLCLKSILNVLNKELINTDVMWVYVLFTTDSGSSP